jgi:multiple sugar transport system permease protein
VNDRASEGATLASERHGSAQPPVRSGRRPRTRWSPMRKAENRAGLALISPTFVIVLVVVVLPIVWTIMLAFQRLRLLNLRSSGLFGTYTLDNFRSVFSSPGFWEALRTTFAYSVCGTASSICIGLIAALAVRRFFHGRTIVRGALLLPYVAPVVATTFVWKTMLSPQSGVANYYGARLLGWDRPVAFLSQRSFDVSILGWHVGLPIALITVIAFEAWRSFPFAFLFLTARLQAVPAMLEEAAMCDGATVSQRFRYVIWPQLLPTVAVLSVLRFIWTFNSFDDIYLLTGGGAGTEVVSVRVFDFLTARGNIGAASAQALVLAAVLTVLVSLYLWRMKTREESV